MPDRGSAAQDASRPCLHDCAPGLCRKFARRVYVANGPHQKRPIRVSPVRVTNSSSSFSPPPLEGDQAPDAEVGIAAHRVRVEANRRRDADLEPCETARTAEIACRLLETGDAARRLVDIERESVPARSMAERAPEGLGRVSADDDRRMGRLRGPRPRLDAAKREEAKKRP